MVALLAGLAKVYIGGKARDYAAGKLENALGLPKDSIGLATNPAGFASGVAKSMATDYGRDAMSGGRDIPVEDRSIQAGPSREIDSAYYGGGWKSGGKVKSKTSSPSKSKVSSASKRGDGIAQRGKTKGRYL